MNNKDLNLLKLESLDLISQIIVFNNMGEIEHSDNTLVQIDKENANTFDEVFFAGMHEELDNLKLNHAQTFRCIETDFFGKRAYFDFEFRLIHELEGYRRYTLIAYDYSPQYTKIMELQQERNIARMQSQKLVKTYNSLKQEKDAVERLYQELKNSDSSEYILLRSDNLLHNVELNDIFYFEAYGDYIKVHAKDKVYVTHNTMKKVEESLPKDKFMRIHRSYIVPFNKVENIEQMSLQIKGKEKIIPIGKTYKVSLLDKMNQL